MRHYRVPPARLSRRPSPKGASAVIAMAALVAASGFAGNFIAARLWEWQAFHGVRPQTADVDFTVLSKHSSRSGYWIDLQSLPAVPDLSVISSSRTYFAVEPGERIILSVETGRWGTQRVTLPDDPRRR